MAAVAFVFAGQGAQHSGMGKTLYAQNPAAKAVLDRLEVLRPGTLSLCFEGTEETLKRTEYTQPALFAVELAVAAALRAEGVLPVASAGFSLGEVCALTDAGAFTLEQGFQAVCRRGSLMQQAADASDAGMVAVLKLTNEQVEALCAEFSGVWPVNYNSPGQLVVAGDRAALPELMAKAKAAGGRAIPLKVGGGFHSPLMAEASREFAQALPAFAPQKPHLPVYSNLTAAPYEETVTETLAAQMCSPVRWEKTVRTLWESGIHRFIEIGPGNTLCGLIQKTIPQAKTCAVETPKGICEAVALYREEGEE